MKRRLYGPMLLLAALLGTASCELETLDNGELEGFWQLAAVDTLATGKSADLRSENLSWGFQGNFLSLLAKGQLDINVIYSFSHRADSLLLMDPYIVARDSGDIKIDDTAIVSYFGINQVEEKFKVRTLNDDALVLETRTLRLRLRKY